MTGSPAAPPPDGPEAFDRVQDVGRRLDEQRAETLARLDAMGRDLESMFAASADSNADDEHDPEGQTIAYERSQLAALRDAAQQQLADIETARERLALGTYGICEVCGRTIPSGRLEARPTARTCVEHAGSVR